MATPKSTAAASGNGIEQKSPAAAVTASLKRTVNLSNGTFEIREGVASDVPAILALIHQLAAYEKEPVSSVTITKEQLLEDGFNPNKPRMFIVILAFMRDPASKSQDFTRAVGMAFCYYTYSTWRGKAFYLEDIVVQSDCRRYGIGSALLSAVIEYAHANDCQRLTWQALDWNQPAFDFYRKTANAKVMKEWITLRMTKEMIQDFVSKVHEGATSAAAPAKTPSSAK